MLPTDALWQGVVYGQPAFVINAVDNGSRSSPFFAAAPPLTIVAWSAIWVVLVLVLAINQLRRREL